MDNSLAHTLRQMIFDYGWQAVLAELAQLSIDYGKPANADLLLQVSYDISRQSMVHQTSVSPRVY